MVWTLGSWGPWRPLEHLCRQMAWQETRSARNVFWRPSSQCFPFWLLVDDRRNTSWFWRILGHLEVSQTSRRFLARGIDAWRWLCSAPGNRCITSSCHLFSLWTVLELPMVRYLVEWSLCPGVPGVGFLVPSIPSMTCGKEFWRLVVHWLECQLWTWFLNQLRNQVSLQGKHQEILERPVLNWVLGLFVERRPHYKYNHHNLFSKVVGLSRRVSNPEG